jgi:hypothetical protein
MQLLCHIDYCHKEINNTLAKPNFNNEQNEKLFTNSKVNLLKQTNDLFRRIMSNQNISTSTIRNKSRKFLFLIAHRNGETHTEYAKRINILRQFLESRVLRTIEEDLETWVRANQNADIYKKAKEKIVNCIRKLEHNLDLSSSNLSNNNARLTNLPKCLRYLLFIRRLNLKGNMLIIYSDNEEVPGLFRRQNTINGVITTPNAINLNNLLELDLSYNQIQGEITLDDFSRIGNLNHLNLSNNQITDIKVTDLNKLRTVNSSNNNISLDNYNNIRQDLVEINESIEINLGTNEDTHIHRNFPIENVRNLTTLNLIRNHQSQINVELTNFDESF